MDEDAPPKPDKDDLSQYNLDDYDEDEPATGEARAVCVHEPSLKDL
jgi:hypothetical protein